MSISEICDRLRSAELTPTEGAQLIDTVKLRIRVPDDEPRDYSLRPEREEC